MNDEKMDKRNKVILISGISVASVTLLATMLSAFHTPEAPDPKQLGPRTKVAYMASKQFASLPEKEKTKYIKSVGRSRSMYRQLSSTERQKVFKNTRKVFMRTMKERTNKFFKMDKEEQNKYLDKMNARRDKWRKAREARRARPKNNSKATTSSNRSTNRTRTTSNNRRGGNRNARRQGFLEGMDSTTRAQWMEIRRLARARRGQQKR